MVSTLEHMQVPKRDRTRCPKEYASSVGMPHPLQMFYLAQLDKKSNSVIRSRSVTVKNWCNVLSMEGVTVYGHHPECRVTLGDGDLILFGKISVPTIELSYRRFQTSLDISLPEKLIGKSHRPQKKPFIRGAIPGVSDEL